MTLEFRADLHCHSTCSDGSDSPLELLKKAKEIGLKGLSITDHDTLEAYTPELFSLAEQLGIFLLPGVEISSEMEGKAIHVLGYGFNLDSPSLHLFLEEMQRRRRERNRAILEKLAKKKMVLTEEELLAFAQRAKKAIGRPHIAELMVKKGYVATPQEAFDRYLKEGGPCFASGFRFTPREVIDEIHEARGKAVLAHPHFFPKGPFLRRLLDFPFDGLECYYAQLPKELERPWIQIAKEKGWIATGGSDYHGALKPHLPLGCSWVDESTFLALHP